MDAVWQLDVELLTNISSVLIPLVTALVTKRLASSQVKGLVTLMLSVINGAVTTAIANDGTVVIGEAVNATFWSFVVAVASYYGVWRQAVAPAIAGRTASFGIGTQAQTSSSTQPEVQERQDPNSAQIDIEALAAGWHEELMSFRKEDLFRRATDLRLTVTTRTSKEELASLLVDRRRQELEVLIPGATELNRL